MFFINQVNCRRTLNTLALACLCHFATPAFSTSPIVSEEVVFAEQNGLVSVEAEHFFKQTATETRAFHLTHQDHTPDLGPDGDPNHVAGASGGAYLEILPDTRRTHADKLIRGENFSPEPGTMAVLHYKVNVQTPGRYYVWVRAYSTGSEDNGLHVGLDGQWPASGQRLQWCQGKHTWRWESRQRTEKQHCGEPGKIFLDINEPGLHTIAFSMREDGFEFDKWLMTLEREFQRPSGVGPVSKVQAGSLPTSFAFVQAKPAPVGNGNSQVEADDQPALQEPRQADGDGSAQISGELKTWHKVSLDLAGPYAHEQDNQPNPFLDYRMTVRWTHENGKTYKVPGYFAADGNAGQSGAESGTVWRCLFAPDQVGTWSYDVEFVQGKNVAIQADAKAAAVSPFDGKSGEVTIQATDKKGRDFRGQGRLNYVRQHYLQFAGSGKYFLKAGADAPETFLGYADFDNTIAGNPKRAPLKTWGPHVQDWRDGDPTWRDGKGKGMIGAINYLSGKGCNVFSFLTYNAGGDGDNVWPFVQRNDKLNYDCSKLDQWGIVFDHGTHKGMYLHFKMQETENDDNRRGKGNQNKVRESLDGGDLGVQRLLYCRELIARFGHNLALNWNIGEENTQSTDQQKAMIRYLAQTDPYQHPIVLHTFPDQQDKVYRPLLGELSGLTGASLQNSSLGTTHGQTVKWVRASAEAGKPWVVAFDESGSASHAQCPDLGYEGYDGRDKSGEMTHTQHDVRKKTLWGVLMAGGGGCEYYFGYKYVQSDLDCEDWRSRDQSWDYCRIAINFFHDKQIPFWEMTNADELVGNANHSPGTYCFAKLNDVYVVFYPDAKHAPLDLSAAQGEFRVQWFNPRIGGELQSGSIESVKAGSAVDLGNPPNDVDEDWVAVVRR